MRCQRCGKKVDRTTILKYVRTNIIWVDNIAVGYECGCFDKWLRFVHEKDPLAKIEKMKWGARIYFSKSEDIAKALAKEFVANYLVKVQFT